LILVRFAARSTRGSNKLRKSEQDIRRTNVRFSNRPVWVKRFQAIHQYSVDVLTGSRFSSESAPRPFHHGVRERDGTIYWAALPSDERQVQRTLRSHLIHRPVRDIMPPRGGTRVSPIRFDYVQRSRCNSVLAPAEFGAINPDAVHDDGQATRQRDDCLFHAPAPGDLHRPGLEPGPFG